MRNNWKLEKWKYLMNKLPNNRYFLRFKLQGHFEFLIKDHNTIYSMIFMLY